MLKKLIIYILAASIILTVPVSYAGTTEAADKPYTVYLFESLGIIDNAEDYLGRLDGTMTRGEFAILSAGLYNGIGSTPAGYQAFADVPNSHAASKAVNLLANNGIISGTSGNNFEPDRAIEYTEALSIILKMLGYGDFIGYNGGYPSGCQAVVNKFKLFAYSGLTGDSTVRNIFTLLYEAAKENIMEITSIGSGYNSSDINKDETLLSLYFDIYYTEGVLTSDGFVNIKSTSTPDKNELIIDGITYQTNTNYYELLGQKVVCFYKDTDTTKATVVFVAPSEENNILVVDGEDAYSFSNMVFKYENENGKTSKINLNNQMDIIYNYTVATQLTENMMLPENGIITFIDNDNDGNYDVAVVKSYISFLVSSISKHDDGILLYGATARNIPTVNVTADGEKDTLIYKDDAKLASTDIKAGMVASVAGTLKDGVLDAREIVLCENKLFGDITGFEEDGENVNLLIDDEVYKVTNSFESIAKNAGFRYGVNFYLDFMGNVVDIAEADMSMLDLALGYIIDINYDDSSLEDILQIKMLTEANKVVIYDVYDSVKIDGETFKGAANIYAALGGDASEPQLITYKISESRKINYIDTAAPFTGQISDDYFNRLTVTKPMSSQYYQKAQLSFDGIVTMDANTRIFVVPETVEGAEDSDFRIITTADISDGSYEVAGYSLNNDKIPSDAIILKSTSMAMPSSSVAMAITQISRTIDADGDETYAVTLMGMKGEEKYTTINNTIIESAESQTESDTKRYKIEVGDIVRITTNSDKQIDKILLLYDYSEKSIKLGYSEDYFARARVAKASVYNILGEYMQISTQDLSTLTPGQYPAIDSLENQKLSKFSVVKYDTTRNKLSIEKGSAADLVSYKDNDVDYSKIIIYTENAIERIIFILD